MPFRTKVPLNLVMAVNISKFKVVDDQQQALPLTVAHLTIEPAVEIIRWP